MLDMNLLEEQRLENLYSYGILDTEDEASFNRIAEDLSVILKIPTVLISFIDRDRQWFKSCIHFQHKETPRGVAFCAHTILQDGAFVVEDAQQHPLFHDNPLVTQDPFIRAYLGVPLKTREGHHIGTICGIDYQSRPFSEWDRDVLTRFGQAVVVALEERLLRKEYQRKLLELQAIMRSSPAGIVLLDRSGHIVGTNPEALHLTGLPLQNGEVFDDQHLRSGPYAQVYCHPTENMYFKVQRSEVHEDLSLLVLENITDHIQNQLLLHNLAFHDALTGLGNRKAFEAKLQHHNNLQDISVLFIDLDDFKQVNDTFGHHVGDLLLQEVAKRLQGALRSGDQVFRLAGDEFTVVLPTCSPEVLPRIAQRLLRTLQTPFVHEGRTVHFGASIGITIGQANDQLPTLLQRADRLMYQVKQSGKNHFLLG